MGSPTDPADPADSRGTDRALAGAVRRLRRRAAWLLTVERTLRLAPPVLLAAGTLVLVLRLGLGVLQGLPLWTAPAMLGGLLFLAAAAAGAEMLLGRRLPPEPVVRALLDRQARAGGLVMAGQEVALGAWGASLPVPVPPRLRFRRAALGRRAGLLALGLVYAAAGWLVPVPRTAAGPLPMDVGHEVGELQGRLEVLEEQGLMSAERSDSLSEQLRQVAEEASGSTPGATWEALDHVQQLADAAAREGAETALERVRQLATAHRLAEALAASTLEAALEAEGAESPHLEGAMAELADLVAEALGQPSEALPEDLSAALSQLAAGGLSTEELRRLGAQLGEQLQERGGELVSALERLQREGGGRIDAEALRRAREMAEGRQAADEALLDFLEENAGRNCRQVLCSEGGNCSRGAPGRGGVSRGRADAPMTWSDEAAAQNGRFQEVALPPSSLEALTRSQLLGLSLAAPEVGEDGAPLPADPGTGGLDTLEGAGGSSVSREVLPRHRGAVRRYFQRDQ